MKYVVYLRGVSLHSELFSDYKLENVSDMFQLLLLLTKTRNVVFVWYTKKRLILYGI